MRRELIEAINIQAKREGFYKPLIKAIFFEELTKKYKSKPLNEVLIDNRGGSWGEDYVKNGIKALSLRSPDIRHGFIDFKNSQKRFYDSISFDKIRLQDGDILVVKSNGSIDLVGKSQVYFSDSHYQNVTASNFLMILRPNQEKIDAKYLDVFLKSPQSLIWRVEKQRTTTGLRNLDTKGYLSMQVPLPDDIEVQKKIHVLINEFSNNKFPITDIVNVNIIELASKISKKINQLLIEIEQQKQLLVQFKQSILQEAIQGKLTENWRVENPNVEPASELLKHIKAEKGKLIKEKKIKKEKDLTPISKEEIPFEIPENWVWVRLLDLCSKTGSGSTPSGGKSVYKDFGIKFIRSQNVYNEGLITKDIAFVTDEVHEKMKGTKVQAEDLLLNITGGSIGRCCIVPSNFDTGNINQHVAIIRTIRKETAYFLHNIVLSPYFQKMILDVQTGAGREGLPKNKMDEILIPFPSAKEQKAIVEKVESLISKCTVLEQEITQSEQHANMLMQAVLKEAFESKMAVVESVQMDRSIQLALMQMMFKQNLGINYGEVIMQKTAYNLDHLYHKESSFFPYSYQSSNHGAFSVQLRLELESNPYLTTQSTEKGKVLCLEPKQKTTVLDAFSNPVYKDYIQSLTQLLEIYSLPIIGKKSNQIELFNTVLKIMNDLGTDKIDEIYASMENWDIEQKGYKTKAEKFSKIATETMLNFIFKLNKDYKNR